MTAGAPTAAAPPDRSRAAAIPALVAIVGCLSTLLLFYPGVLPLDAITMYEQVASGSRSDHKPPLYVDLWRLTDAVVCGSGGIFALHVVLHWCGALALALAIASSPFVRVGLVIGMGLLPPVFGRLPMVSVDCAVVVAWSLAAGLLLHRDLSRPALAGGRRNALTGAAFVLIAYGVLVRHNAIAGVMPLLWLLVTPADARTDGVVGSRRPWVAAIALTVLLAVGAQAYNRTATPMRPWTPVLIWDLAAISLQSREMLMPLYVLRDPGAGDGLQRLEQHFSSWSSTRLIYFGDRYTISPPIDSERARRLLRDWMAAVAAHPRHYARHRASVLLRQLGFEGVPSGPLFSEDPLVSEAMSRCHGALPIHFEPSAATNAIRRGLLALTRTALYRVWLWAGVALALVIAAGRLAGARGRFARAIACSGLLYVAPLAVVAPAVEFRYTLWLYPATAIAIALTAAALVARRRERGGDAERPEVFEPGDSVAP